MNKIVLAAVLVGCCFAMPQQQSGSPKVNPYVKILEYESFQNGKNYGHALQQEDGTATGQKVGPDGLLYGFYSYVQADGNRVKVYYRAGQGVGYEVLKVEGLDEKSLGNLKATVSNTPQQEVAPRRPAPRQPTQSVHQTIAQTLNVQRPVQQPAPVPRQQPVPVVQPRQPLPVVPQVNPLPAPLEPEPAPHRFDYPANLNLQRTGTGYRSSFKAL